MGAGTSFVILAGNKDTTSTDLQFQEYSGIVERALDLRGFQRASSTEKADIAILLSYGISDPKEHVYNYSVPQYGQTGVSSATTYGNVSGNAYRYGQNTVHGSANYSNTTYYTPTYGVIGYSNHTSTYVTYTRYVSIEAIDLPAHRSQNKIVQIWKTDIVSVGSSGDLRRVFPVMIGAASSYLGTNTGANQEVTIYEDDPRVLFVKGLPAEPEK